ncbi:MAG: hypothetical protein H6698_03285 [Myxococcales bacterium]|nr:hypothetical protein [Myxococcales bacterium]MCB9519326.1 hypothetical protein [Myxococcales bacterium]MCB9530770.1 hypothetical protein [Myxococcales bacterium]MCB9533336.1 hypothetical protein [Myxococcales bacterium]
MRRTLKVTLLAVAAGGALAGCAENTPEIAVTFNLPFTDECEVPSASSGANTVYQSRGTLDLFVRNSYLMAPRLENTLVPSEDARIGSATGGAGGLQGTDWEANSISLRRAVIRFDGPDALDLPLPKELTREISGTITPGGVATTLLEAIPESLGRTLEDARILRQGTHITLNLHIKYFGETYSGREVDSNEFIYPIELCYGCLLNFPVAAVDFSYDVLPNCRNIGDTEIALPCFPGQDDIVDCRAVCPIVTVVPDADPEGICEPVTF